MNQKTDEIATFENTVEIDVLEKTEFDIPHQHEECCGNYLPGVEELDRFTKYVSIRNQDDIYRGKPFKYCPWCGEKK